MIPSGTSRTCSVVVSSLTSLISFSGEDSLAGLTGTETAFDIESGRVLAAARRGIGGGAGAGDPDLEGDIDFLFSFSLKPGELVTAGGERGTFTGVEGREEGRGTL